MAHHQLRARLGNDIAMKAFRERKLPFPYGCIIAALHWNEVSSDENNKVLAVGSPGAELDSSVPESAVNVQIMVKDSTKYAATGGWGFADFTNGKPGSEALQKSASPATSLRKLTSTFSHTTRGRHELERCARDGLAPSDLRRDRQEFGILFSRDQSD